MNENKSGKKDAEPSKGKPAESSCFIINGCQGKKWCEYISCHKSQSLIFAFLVLGLLLLLFSDSWFGGLILGGVIGYYFSPDIVFYLRNLGHHFSGEERMRNIILAALLLGILISSPGIFIGAVVIAALRQVLWG